MIRHPTQTSFPNHFGGVRSNSMAGARVQVTIEEDGTPKPPQLPPGTITRKLVGTDRTTYYVVTLDHPVSCTRAKTREGWTLRTLVVAPKFQGAMLEKIYSPGKSYIHVGMANVLTPLEEDSPIPDFSRVVYFATGTVGKL